MYPNILLRLVYRTQHVLVIYYCLAWGISLTINSFVFCRGASTLRLVEIRREREHLCSRCKNRICSVVVVSVLLVLFYTFRIF